MPNRQLSDPPHHAPSAAPDANVVVIGERRDRLAPFEPPFSEVERGELRALLREHAQLRAEIAMLRAQVDENGRVAHESRHQLQSIRFGCPQARRILGD
jgi:hypothetical protein